MAEEKLCLFVNEFSKVENHQLGLARVLVQTAGIVAAFRV